MRVYLLSYIYQSMQTWGGRMTEGGRVMCDQSLVGQLIRRDTMSYYCFSVVHNLVGEGQRERKGREGVAK